MKKIEIYCKANKRNREDKTVYVCAHIIKEDEHTEEDVYTIEMEGNGVKLELAALMNALLDLDGEERLTKDKLLELYVHNEHLFKTLSRWEASQSDQGQVSYEAEEKYQAEWKEIGELLAKCGAFKVHGLEKKYRDENDETVTQYMGHLNRMVCGKVNQ